MTNCLACHGTGRFVLAYDKQALPTDVRPCPYCGGKGVVVGEDRRGDSA